MSNSCRRGGVQPVIAAAATANWKRRKSEMKTKLTREFKMHVSLQAITMCSTTRHAIERQVSCGSTGVSSNVYRKEVLRSCQHRINMCRTSRERNFVIKAEKSRFRNITTKISDLNSAETLVDEDVPEWLRTFDDDESLEEDMKVDGSGAYESNEDFLLSGSEEETLTEYDKDAIDMFTENWKGEDRDNENSVLLSSSSTSPPISSSAAVPGASKSESKKRRSSSSGASSVSSGVRLEDVSKRFKFASVLESVNFDVKKGERVGLVGYNGAGKTTILRMITGEIEHDSGEILLARPNMKIAYLTQEFEVDESRSVRDEFRSASEETVNVLSQLEMVQRELESISSTAEGSNDGSEIEMNRMGDLLDELDVLQKRADALNVDKIDSEIDKMMPTLGFKPEDNQKPVSSFSGGWQMRMSLGKILLQEPDMLMLDEPTNHIDVDTVEWLEGYLRERDIPMIIVSHDRYFLDQVCTKIVEIDRGVSHTWKGNYSEFMRQKTERDQAQLMAYLKQQKEIQKQNDLIRRLMMTTQTGRLESARKQRDQMMSDENFINKPFVEKRREFRFPSAKPTSPDAIIVKDLMHNYGEKILFDCASIDVNSGDRVALMGPNGVGKSTLLRFVLGHESPSGSGTVRLGKDDMTVGFFRQNQAEGLDTNLTVFDTINRAASEWSTSDVKALLGRFNFKSDEIKKKVSSLSGGEKARLALAKFMVTPAELLVLDEPTNHRT